MKGTVAAVVGTRRVLLLDSITSLDEEHAGHIIVSASHGGRSSGDYAMRWPLLLCCFNDAGVGKDRAGIVALDMLEGRGTPALAYGYMSARIGEARDAWDNGIVTHANAPARAIGVEIGESLRDAITRRPIKYP